MDSHARRGAWSNARKICNPTLRSQNNTDRREIAVYEAINLKRVHCTFKEKCHPWSWGSSTHEFQLRGSRAEKANLVDFPLAFHIWPELDKRAMKAVVSHFWGRGSSAYITLAFLLWKMNMHTKPFRGFWGASLVSEQLPAQMNKVKQKTLDRISEDICPGLLSWPAQATDSNKAAQKHT